MHVEPEAEPVRPRETPHTPVMSACSEQTEKERAIEAQVIAIIIVLPFALAFIYAGVHEYMRFKSDGRANYGLVYNEETGTTHITGIPEDEEAFDPDEFDPNNYRDLELRRGTDDERS